MKTTFRRVRGITIAREIAPYGLVAKATRWYVIWLGKDEQLHVDRASAVVEAELLDERFERPDTFELAAYWSQWAARHEANRSVFPVMVLAELGILPALDNELGKDHVLRSGEPGRDGRVRLQLTFEYFEQARAMLLGFGGAIEVVSPEALRRSMADFGEQIQSTYRDS